MALTKTLLLLASLLSHSLAVHTATVNGTTDLIPPKNDPWYTAPPDFVAAVPGQILRIRPAPGNLTAVTGNCSAAYHILYRTSDSQVSPTWAVTTLFVPEQVYEAPGIPGGGGALVSYQVAYDSADLNASPSYALYTSPQEDIGQILGNGWFVSVPDYEGPLAAYTAGINSGYATLDSVRAVRSSSFGLAPDARYVMWGYSGGALASEWALELQAAYAPGLVFSGAALGGLPPNITSVLNSINGHAAAALIPSAFLGLFAQYPTVLDFFLSNLRSDGPYNKTGFLAARNMTLDQAEPAFAMQDISKYFYGGFSFLQDPRVQHIINNEGQMGYHGIPQSPLYVYKAVADEITRIADTDALIDRYCRLGVTVLYTKNLIGGHAAESLNGQAGAVSWLQSVLTGSFHMAGCRTEVVAVNITNSPLR